MAGVPPGDGQVEDIPFSTGHTGSTTKRKPGADRQTGEFTEHEQTSIPLIEPVDGCDVP
jgi:hypothetical protein